MKESLLFRVAELIKKCGGVSNADLTLNATFSAGLESGTRRDNVDLNTSPPVGKCVCACMVSVYVGVGAFVEFLCLHMQPKKQRAPGSKKENTHTQTVLS